MCVCFLRFFGGAFCAFIRAGQLKSGQETGERGNDMQQRATGGTEPRSAAARTQPLHMGRLPHQPSHWVPHVTVFLPFFYHTDHPVCRISSRSVCVSAARTHTHTHTH